jgi:predicted ribosome quality control (RQC) complex YloA/Tae2 family protein
MSTILTDNLQIVAAKLDEESTDVARAYAAMVMRAIEQIQRLEKKVAELREELIDEHYSRH